MFTKKEVIEMMKQAYEEGYSSGRNADRFSPESVEGFIEDNDEKVYLNEPTRKAIIESYEKEANRVRRACGDLVGDAYEDAVCSMFTALKTVKEMEVA